MREDYTNELYVEYLNYGKSWPGKFVRWLTRKLVSQFKSSDS